MTTSTQSPTAQLTVATFDSSINSPVFRVARTASMREFGKLAEYLYTPDNMLHEEGRHGGGSTPLRDATMEMIHYLDRQRSPGTVQIGMLLDESGSMMLNRYAVIEGVNEFVAGLADVPANEGNRVLCVIFTDGFENASRHVTSEALRQAIAEREGDGWTFIYLGANQDAWNEGSKYGLSGGVRGQTVSYSGSAQGTQAAVADVADMSKSYLAGEESYRVTSEARGTKRNLDEEGRSSKADAQTTPPRRPRTPMPKPSPYSDVAKAIGAARSRVEKKDS